MRRRLKKRKNFTFPSKINCFLLLISFFSSKSVDSSLCRTGDVVQHSHATHSSVSPLNQRTLKQTYDFTLPSGHVDLGEDLQDFFLLHRELLQFSLWRYNRMLRSRPGHGPGGVSRLGPTHGFAPRWSGPGGCRTASPA